MYSSSNLLICTSQFYLKICTYAAFIPSASPLPPLRPALIIHPTIEKAVNAKLADDASAAADDNVGDTGKGQQQQQQQTQGCLTTENVYRPLMDDKQLDLFTKAAKDLPQWVESLTREELMEAVPGSAADCLGGE